MNSKGNNNIKQEELSSMYHDQCEICTKKDEEDLYIIFNVLYRVVIGGVFHRRLKDEGLSYELNMMQRLESEVEEKGLKDEEQTPEQKIFFFKEKINRDLLIGLITSQEFIDALKDIFRAKYETLDANCRHFELAMHFIKSFDISNESPKEAPNQEMNEIIPKIKSLHSSILLIKSEIQAYHTEIQNLSDHIVSKLFTSHSNLIKKYIKDDEKQDKEDEDDNEESDGEDDKSFSEEHLEENQKKVHKRLVKNNKASSSGSNGTTDGNRNSEKSTEATLSIQNRSESRKQAKSPTFKSKLPKKATDVLKTWFLNHIQNPYPSHEAKETLSKLTGLSKKQIQNWFTNSRKRFLEPLKKKIDNKKKPDEDHGSHITEKNSIIEDHISQSRRTQTPDKHSIQSVPTETHTQPQSQPQPLPQSIQTQMFPEIPTTQPQFIIPQVNIQDPNKYPQRVIPATIQPATIMYQGYIPTNNFNQGGNIVILQPCMVPQPSVVYPYAQQVPRLMPMNTQIVQIPQNNTITVLNQPNLMGGSYIVPMQPSIGLMTKHNLSTNFNTINNNVYNSINNMGSSNTEPVSIVETPIEGIPNGQQTTEQNGQSQGQKLQNLLQAHQQMQAHQQFQAHQQQMQSHQQNQAQAHQLQHLQQLQQFQHYQQLNLVQQHSNGGESSESNGNKSTQKPQREKHELYEVYNTTKQIHKDDGKET